ncbi:uncharacterized protein LOC134836174 [Culicoides brevitarsis]|uniref:uncharacterized protein LOC134836174 n=1 Tax=Culicoides brevitarsis TaxID=469753 RepID=UPI00307C0FE5
MKLLVFLFSFVVLAAIPASEGGQCFNEMSYQVECKGCFCNENGEKVCHTGCENSFLYSKGDESFLKTVTQLKCNSDFAFTLNCLHCSCSKAGSVNCKAIENCTVEDETKLKLTVFPQGGLKIKSETKPWKGLFL